MAKSEIQRHREFLQDRLRLTIDFRRTDQHQGVEPPPLQKLPRPDQPLIPLPGPETFKAFAGTDLLTAIENRRSHRRFKPQALTLAELALLLWTTQGIQSILGPGTALRPVPSAGCRHAFETYLLISRVEDLLPGLYRYLPVDHALVCERPLEPAQIRTALVPATLNQRFVASAPVTFAWTTLPYRMEWRYDLAAHRVIAIDAGHLCQNLYLACETINAGTCAIAAYNQDLMDELLGVDGEEEFCVYLAPVGKV